MVIVTLTDVRSTVPAVRRRRPALDIVQWVVVAIGVIGGLILPLLGVTPVAVVFACGVVIGFTHGIRRYGRRRLVAFFVISFVVSNFWEDLSIGTGFPFGNYHYTSHPQLIDVPVQIGVVYFGLGYISWMTANAVLGNADRALDIGTRAGRVNVIALPLLAGSTMTMFDVGADSISATVQKNWIWEDGGGLFGVPWTNYIGWWFVTWSFFQVFTLLLAHGQSRGGKSAPAPGSMLQPVLLTLVLGLSSIPLFFTLDAPASVTDESGVAWGTADLYESMMTVNVFGLVAVALFALTRIARGDLNDPT
jgi:uncharacterized membrane protein